MLATLSLSLSHSLSFSLSPLALSLSFSLSPSLSLAYSLSHSVPLMLVVLAYYRAVSALCSGGNPSFLEFYLSSPSGCADMGAKDRLLLNVY